MKISIFGLGYVGSVGLGCLAKLGHQVIGVDVNEVKVRFINEGKSPIIEKELDAIITEASSRGAISATIDTEKAVMETNVSFICVGTPSTQNGHLNLEAIFRVARDIGLAIGKKNSFHVVALRSTVLPGTNKKITTLIQESSAKLSGKDFAVVSNPEFLREGTSVKDFFEPPFTILGTDCPRAAEIMRNLYTGIKAPTMETEIGVAEIIKYVNNSFHALKITFANEVGNICKRIGINSHELMNIFCMDTKLNLSAYYLKPGFSFGGSCLPKDLKALATIAHDVYLKCPILESINVSNELQKDLVCNQIVSYGKQRIGILGLSFKAGTDDLRSSPIIDILEKLLGKGFDIRVYDKNVHVSQLMGANKEYILQRIPFISRFLTSNLPEVIELSEVLVIVNQEPEFKDLSNVVRPGTVIYDLVNIGMSPKSDKFTYSGIAW